MELKEFCEKLPKAELHAHLAGSVSRKTIGLFELPAGTDKIMDTYKDVDQSTKNLEMQIEQVFQLFDIIHNVMNTKSALHLATIETIREFYEDNVIYLELRTTPRIGADFTKKEYIETVISAIDEALINKSMTIKLILCINRTHTIEESRENLQLILEMRALRPSLIVGIDLCGNPQKGQFCLEIFEEARKNGLKVTLHCAEFPNHDDNNEILNFKPDRIGHGCYLHPKYGGTTNCLDSYISQRIPLEICLTSNVIAGIYPKGYGDHHLQEWIGANLPYCLCTDDKGVFNTDLSKEFLAAAETFNLSREKLFEICKSTVDYSFLSNEDKVKIKKLQEQWKTENAKLFT